MHILITGTLHKPAVTRTSSNGNTYTTANIRTTQKNRNGETEPVWTNVVAFRDEARETLARLAAGDAVSIGGSFTVGIWERDGQPYPSISVVADTVAVARPAPRKPEPRSPAPGPAVYTPPDEPVFDDDIPF